MSTKYVLKAYYIYFTLLCAIYILFLVNIIENYHSKKLFSKTLHFNELKNSCLNRTPYKNYRKTLKTQKRLRNQKKLILLKNIN